MLVNNKIENIKKKKKRRRINLRTQCQTNKVLMNKLRLVELVFVK